MMPGPMASADGELYGPSPVSRLSREVIQLSRLAGPVVATQLGTMMMGVVDTLMVSRVSTDALASATLGNMWVFGTIMFAQGAVMGMDPFVSQAHGARDGERVALALQRGVVIALCGSVPIMAAWLATADFLIAAGQSEDLARAAGAYVWTQIPSLPLFMLFFALRQYLQGRALVMPAFWVMLAANVFNAFANWVLIFGHLGAPPLGLVGAGIATGLNRAFLFVALLGWVLWHRIHEGAWRHWDREPFRLQGLVQMLRIGLPVALTLGLEAWAFSITTLMAGRLGTVALAAHAIVLNVISLIFMLPLGISIGASTRVGNLIGAGEEGRARRAAGAALLIGGGIMLGSALTLFFLREELPLLYAPEVAVVAAAAWVFPVAAAFQIVDGLQVVSAGILRGMGRTRIAAAANFVGYYVLALPVAWYLGLHLEFGLPGVWWGLAAGLAAVAGVLVFWVFRSGPALRVFD